MTKLFILIISLFLITFTSETNSNMNVTNSTLFEGNRTDNVSDEIMCIQHNMTCEEYVEYIDDILEYVKPTSSEWVLIALQSILFVVGLIGNALVCIAVYRNKSMRTVTNYYIVNLAVADFLVILICLPPTVVWDVTETWFMGLVLCRVVLYSQTVSVAVSVMTLTFISIDRWYAICYPLQFRSTTSRAKYSIIFIWIASLLFDLPELVYLNIKDSLEIKSIIYFDTCVPTWTSDIESIFQGVRFILLYFLPLGLMSITYYQIVRVLWRSDNIPGHSEVVHLNDKFHTEADTNGRYRRATIGTANSTTESQIVSRRKAAKMLVVVVSMFAACYFPVHLLSIVRTIWDVPQNEATATLSNFCHFLVFANSAINPIIYNFMSKKFRGEFMKIYCCYIKGTPSLHSTVPIQSRPGSTYVGCNRLNPRTESTALYSVQSE
uniref:Orexin receptor type 2 n=1 Tax=Cacopsylla melanoneura TaxID=428564 RepID=A0A8D8QUD3_9HEMI